MKKMMKKLHFHDLCQEYSWKCDFFTIIWVKMMHMSFFLPNFTTYIGELCADESWERAENVVLMECGKRMKFVLLMGDKSDDEP